MTSSDRADGTARNPPRRSYRSPAAWFTLLTVLVLGLALDLGSKTWSFQRIADEPVVLDRAAILASPEYPWVPWHEPVHVLPARLLDFRLVINHGAVFGIGQNQRFVFIVFTFIALTVAFWVFGRMTLATHRLAHLGLGFILAGGLGNLYDRITFGVVRDFLHMLPGRQLPFGWKWPGGSSEMFPWVFNVADVMLLLGMALLMIHVNRLEKHRRIAEQSAAKPSGESTPPVVESSDSTS